jgi:molybdopterin-guanine dinucleotide biosynthesis protein A
MNSVPNTHPEPTTGLILCGGQGHRMGGQDKGLLDFHGRRLIEIAIDRLRPQVDAMLVNANRNLPAYQALGFPVVTDPHYGEDHLTFQGPLAGILAGLNAMEHRWLITVPCDCPLFPLDLVSQLRRASATFTRAAYIQSHPTFALIPVSAKDHLNHFLQHGRRKLGQWLEEIGAYPIPPGDESSFRNLNTPQDMVD